MISVVGNLGIVHRAHAILADIEGQGPAIAALLASAEQFEHLAETAAGADTDKPGAPDPMECAVAHGRPSPLIGSRPPSNDRFPRPMPRPV